jgi:hypothetical protein
VRFVVVGNGLSIEKFTCIEGVVSGVLKPDRKVFLIEAMGNELGIASWRVVR